MKFWKVVILHYALRAVPQELSVALLSMNPPNNWADPTQPTDNFAYISLQNDGNVFWRVCRILQIRRHAFFNALYRYDHVTVVSGVHAQMTIVVLSANFLRTVWSAVDFRSMLVHKVDSQRHRFLFVFLDDDVTRDAADPDIPDDRKQLYDCAATQCRLAAGDPRFAERLCDYLLPPASGPQVDQFAAECCEVDESLALIANCRHQRYWSCTGTETCPVSPATCWLGWIDSTLSTWFMAKVV